LKAGKERRFTETENMRKILLLVVIVLLAFIAFFVLATQMSAPVPANIVFSKHNEQEKDYSKVKSKLNLIILPGDDVYSYLGDAIETGKHFFANQLHDHLSGQKKVLPGSVTIFIKTDKNSPYQKTVDVLDEMTINDFKDFVIVDINEKEKQFLAKNNL
jgi:biopolymer transport protein ExbD